MKFFIKLGIRGKILISVSLFLILFFIIEATLFYQVFLNGFKAVEEDDMITDIQRVEGLIDEEINNYSIKLSDWSNWDDTYNFIVNNDQKYIDSNLQDTSLSNLKVNFMIYIASSGAIVHEKGISLETTKDIPVPKDFHDLLLRPGVITTHLTPDSKSQGIVRLSSGFIAFVSRPILNSNGQGPIRGTLVFARYFDKVLLKKIADLERSQVTIYDYNSLSLPQDFADAKRLMPIKGIKHEEPSGEIDLYYVNSESENAIDGFTIINDIYEKPAFIIENQLSRPFYALGNKIVLFALGIFAVISIFSILFAFLMLNILVISKITKLKKDVHEVRNPNNPTKTKLDIKGNDELTDLATDINAMLLELENLHKKDLEAVRIYKQISEESQTKAKELEEMNRLMVDRELKMIELKKEITELKAKQVLLESKTKTNTENV